MRRAGVAVRFDWAVAYLLQERGLDHALGVVAVDTCGCRAQLKDLVNGIVAVKAHNDTGHLSYLLGQVRITGWWYFYLVALAVKTPIAAARSPDPPVWRGWRGRAGGSAHSWQLAPAVLVVTLLAFASAFSRINIGIRHVLIVYPFLALGAAYMVAACLARRSRRCARRAPRWRRAAVLCAPALAAEHAVRRAYPDYLPYFNEAVAHPERVLVDSDLDWGQDLYAPGAARQRS